VDTAGITGALQVADTAFGFELPVILAASPGHLNAHLAAAIPTCMSMAVHTGDASGLLASDVRIEDGWAVVGDAPGHGIVVDPSIFTGPATDGRRASRGRA
jgi:L-alanine-DL-glutamate epimerase-like enolase superfamily enzyme